MLYALVIFLVGGFFFLSCDWLRGEGGERGEVKGFVVNAFVVEVCCKGWLVGD